MAEQRLTDVFPGLEVTDRGFVMRLTGTSPPGVAQARRTMSRPTFSVETEAARRSIQLAMAEFDMTVWRRICMLNSDPIVPDAPEATPPSTPDLLQQEQEPEPEQHAQVLPPAEVTESCFPDSGFKR